MKRNRGDVEGQRKRRRARVQSGLDAIKLEAGCQRCGLEGPAFLLDFHHRDPSTKKFSINAGVRMYCLAVLLEEAEKCDVYCANCHRIVEHEARTPTAQ